MHFTLPSMESPQIHISTKETTFPVSTTLRTYSITPTSVSEDNQSLLASILGGKPIFFSFSTSELQPLTSSDLWVSGTILNANDTGVSAGVQYAVGSVYGNVKTSILTFLNFSVPGQAFSMFQNCRCPFCADVHSSPG